MGNIFCANFLWFRIGCFFLAANLLGMLPHGCQLVTSVNGGGGVGCLTLADGGQGVLWYYWHLFGFRIWLSDQKSKWHFCKQEILLLNKIRSRSTQQSTKWIYHHPSHHPTRSIILSFWWNIFLHQVEMCETIIVGQIVATSHDPQHRKD